MKAAMVLFAALVLVTAHEGRGQTEPANQVAAQELQPPHEELYRAQEDLGAVLCKSRIKKAYEREFERRYRKRIVAVHAAVGKEFGKEVANREILSVLPCRRYGGETRFRSALKAAETKFVAELRYWETRYKLGQGTR